MTDRKRRERVAFAAGIGKNLVIDPNDISSANWTRNSLTATADNALAPNGLVKADLATSGGSGSNLISAATLTFLATTNYAVGRYFKASNLRWAFLAISDESAHAFGSYFDLQNGVIGSKHQAGAGTCSVQTIQDVGGGWFWCTFVGQFSSQKSAVLDTRLAAADGNVASANGKAAWLWGATINKSNYPVSLLRFMP